MNNTEKLLRAFIETTGYDVEEICEQVIPSGQIIVAHDYKVTKKRLYCFGESTTEMSEGAEEAFKPLDFHKKPNQRKRNFIVSAFAEHDAGAITKSELIDLFVKVL